MQPEYFNYQASKNYQREQQEQAERINAATAQQNRQQTQPTHKASIYRPALHALGRRLVKLGYALQGQTTELTITEKTAHSM